LLPVCQLQTNADTANCSFFLGRNWKSRCFRQNLTNKLHESSREVKYYAEPWEILNPYNFIQSDVSHSQEQYFYTDCSWQPILTVLLENISQQTTYYQYYYLLLKILEIHLVSNQYIWFNKTSAFFKSMDQLIWQII
jgi:hypothetical protein